MCNKTLQGPPVNDTSITSTSHYVGIKILNNLPPYIKDVPTNLRKFDICLKRFLHIHSFYSIKEYFQYKSITR